MEEVQGIFEEIKTHTVPEHLSQDIGNAINTAYMYIHCIYIV